MFGLVRAGRLRAVERELADVLSRVSESVGVVLKKSKRGRWRVEVLDGVSREVLLVSSINRSYGSVDEAREAACRWLNVGYVEVEGADE